jgi:hypothetical protein
MFEADRVVFGIRGSVRNTQLVGRYERDGMAWSRSLVLACSTSDGCNDPCALRSYPSSHGNDNIRLIFYPFIALVFFFISFYQLQACNIEHACTPLHASNQASMVIVFGSSRISVSTLLPFSCFVSQWHSTDLISMSVEAPRCMCAYSEYRISFVFFIVARALTQQAADLGTSRPQSSTAIGAKGGIEVYGQSLFYQGNSSHDFIFRHGFINSSSR